MPQVPTVQGQRQRTAPIAVAPSGNRIQPVLRNDVPNFTDGARIAGQAIERAGRAFEEGVNRAVTGASKMYAESREAARKRAVQTMLLGEQNKLDEFSLDLQNEIYQRRGQNAFGAPDEFTKKYDEYVASRIQEIPDAEAQFMFTKVASGRRNGALTKVYGHERNEMDSFTNSTLDATIETAKRRALQNFNDPNEVNNSIGAARDAILVKARMNGLPDVAMQNEMEKLKRDIQFTVAQRQIINDPSSFDPNAYAELPAKDLMDLQTSAYNLRERAEREVKEANARELYTGVMNGTVTARQVQAMRASLDFSDYVKLNKMAVEDNPTTDGSVYAGLLAKFHRGGDISDDLEAARFADRTLSNQDYKQFLDMMDKGDVGINDPVSSIRRYVLGSVGGSATVVDVAKSRTLSNANLDYDRKIEAFVKENGRQPTTDEAKKIGDEIITAYDVIGLDEISTTLPKPKMMTGDERRGFSTSKTKRQKSVQTIEAVKQRTMKMFMQKHGNDKQKVVNDPEYREEMRRINAFSSILGEE